MLRLISLIIVPHKMAEIRERCFNQIYQNVVYEIFVEHLSFSDVCSLMQIDKTMYNISKNNDRIWEIWGNAHSNMRRCKALSMVIRKGRYDIAKGLIRSGIEPPDSTLKKYLFLHLACEFMHVDILKLMLKHGNFDINARERKALRTPLHIAVMRCDIDAIEVLLENGADVNAIDNEQNTPLYCAVECRHDINGIDNNDNSNYIDVITLLLDSGADINDADRNERSILYRAFQYTDTKLIDLLIKYDANINAVNDYGNTILQGMLYWLSFETGTLELLIKYGIDVNNRNRIGFTILHYLAIEYECDRKNYYRNGFLNAIKLLLKHGADPTIRCNDGKTALQWSHNCYELRKILP